MDKLKQTAAGTVLRLDSYVSPTAKITQIHSEGLLCLSMRLLEEWKPADSFDWDE